MFIVCPIESMPLIMASLIKRTRYWIYTRVLYTPFYKISLSPSVVFMFSFNRGKKKEFQTAVINLRSRFPRVHLTLRTPRSIFQRFQRLRANEILATEISFDPFNCNEKVMSKFTFKKKIKLNLFVTMDIRLGKYTC